MVLDRHNREFKHLRSLGTSEESRTCHVSAPKSVLAKCCAATAHLVVLVTFCMCTFFLNKIREKIHFPCWLKRIDTDELQRGVITREGVPYKYDNITSTKKCSLNLPSLCLRAMTCQISPPHDSAPQKSRSGPLGSSNFAGLPSYIFNISTLYLWAPCG